MSGKMNWRKAWLHGRATVDAKDDQKDEAARWLALHGRVSKEKKPGMGTSPYRMQRTIINGVASEWEPY
jgi:hypothetical protein